MEWRGLLTSRTVLALTACLTACLALASLPARASSAIKLGAYSAVPGQPNALDDAHELDRYIAKVGRTPDILMDYSNPTDPLLSQAEIANLQSHGIDEVMVTWQLYKSGWDGPTNSLTDVANGRFDSDLRAAAGLARSLPFTFYIRFAHEMNGKWYDWTGDPTAYVSAFRHVVSVFRSEAATNVKFVFSPLVNIGGKLPFTAYFPGDAWVDYVALDGYNWGTGGAGENKWQSLEQVFASSYQELTRLSSRPVMIGETASSDSGGDKGAWIREGFLKTIPSRFPRVEAVIWFDRNQEQNWRIESSSSSLEAYRSVVASSLYGGPVSTPQPPPSGGTPTGGSSGAPGLTTGKQSGKLWGKKTVVQALRVTRRVRSLSFASRRVGAGAPGRRLHGRVTFALSQQAAVRIVIQRRTDRGRFVRRLTMTRHSHAGRSRVSFAQLVGHRRLRRGGYRVVVRALDRDGRRSPARRAGFRVV